jgi:polar amino acid transport system substrate-binding protein
LYRLEKRDDIHLSQRGQLRQWRIGTLFASASQQQLQQLGLPVGTGQDSAHSDAANLAKLKLGRVDLIAMLDWAMHWQLQQAGLPERTVKPAALLDGQGNTGMPSIHKPRMTR